MDNKTKNIKKSIIIAFTVIIFGNFLNLCLNLDYNPSPNPKSSSQWVNPTLLGHSQTVDQIYGIFLKGDYLISAGRSHTALEIIDISIPTNPTNISVSFNSDNANSIDIAGDYAFIGDHDLEIYNITDPSSPSLMSTNSEISAENHLGINGLVVAGNFLYATTVDGFWIVNISDITHPILIGNISLTTHQQPYFIEIADQVAYLSCFGGLTVVNITNPLTPEILMDFDYTWSYSLFPFEERYYPGKLQIVGDVLYFRNNRTGGIEMFDISNQFIPISINNLTLGYASGFYYVEEKDLLYVGANTLTILNVSDPQNPVELRKATLHNDFEDDDFIVTDDFIYIANRRNGFYIFDSGFDFDEDGLSDGAEIYLYNTLPDNPDSDGDGYTDFEEVNAGSDPNDSEHTPRDVLIRKILIWSSIGVGIAGIVVGSSILLGKIYKKRIPIREEKKKTRQDQQNKYREMEINHIKKGKNPIGAVSLAFFFIELLGFVFLLNVNIFVIGMITGAGSFILGIIGLVRSKRGYLRSGSCIPGIIFGTIAMAIDIWMLYMVFSGQGQNIF